MFIGHFALGFASKKITPRTSLGNLFLSVAFLDLLWPLFLVLGWEHVRIAPGITAVTPLDFYDYPLSHSLVATLFWSLIFGSIYFLLSRNGRGTVIVTIGVLSHWILDFVSHRPDMPIGMGAESPKYGLGLWNSVMATLLIEIPLFFAGVTIYSRGTQAKNAIGKWGLFTFVVFLLFLYAGNIFGPPPPNERILGQAALATALFYVIPFWIDKNRAPVP